MRPPRDRKPASIDKKLTTEFDLFRFGISRRSHSDLSKTKLQPPIILPDFGTEEVEQSRR
jgi:hypothetical protein